MVCVVGRMRDLILQLSKSSIYSTKPIKSGCDDAGKSVCKIILNCVWAQTSLRPSRGEAKNRAGVSGISPRWREAGRWFRVRASG
ncbi:hypothetical protein ENZ43_25490 [Klebsiella pneumoniae]|nr:hypothetical protein ENZ43_25490 [Klebsiella pneumoniae]